MTFRSAFLALALAGMMAAPAFAADTIAVVNIQQIMHDSTAAQSAKEQIDAKTKAFQSQMSKKEEDLQKEDQELKKEQAVLSQDAFDKKVKEFRTKATAAQREVQEKRSELDNALSSAIGEIQKAVLDITTGIAHDKGYTLVIPASQQLYFDSRLDITKDVLTKLNAKLPKIAVNFTASPARGMDSPQ